MELKPKACKLLEAFVDEFNCAHTFVFHVAYVAIEKALQRINGKLPEEENKYSSEILKKRLLNQ